MCLQVPKRLVFMKFCQVYVMENRIHRLQSTGAQELSGDCPDLRKAGIKC